MNQAEDAFYAKPAPPAFRRGRPPSNVRLADDIDTMELMVPEHIFVACSPLIDRLRTRTLGRRGHERLVALLTANALATGQPDETALILATIEKLWGRCWFRWLPPLPRWRWL